MKSSGKSKKGFFIAVTVIAILLGMLLFTQKGRISCSLKGDSFHYIATGSSRTPTCVEVFPDGGKSCENNNDCAGYCLKADGSQTGTCEERYPSFGCKIHRDIGFACVD